MKLHTETTRSKQAFDALFVGFRTLRAVSYVVAPRMLLRFFERGFHNVEIVVGDNLVQDYQARLAEEPLDATERLYELIDDGRLTVYGTTRTLHSKLYLLESDRARRAICGSGNFTETASQGRQVNHFWIADFEATDLFGQAALEDTSGFWAQCETAYETHRSFGTPFMRDLQKLMRERQEPNEKIFRLWLGTTVTDEEADIQEVFLDLRAQAFDGGDAAPKGTPQGAPSPVLTLVLPEGRPHRRGILRALEAFEPKEVGGTVHVPRSVLLDHRHKAHLVPLMHVDSDKRMVHLGLEGRAVPRSIPIDTARPKEVDRALAHLEAFVDLAAHGETQDLLAVQCGIFETLLYVLTAPFFHEHRRAQYAVSPGGFMPRGPRFLFLFGESYNGKTTLLRFALSLLCGRPVQPLSGEVLERDAVFSVVRMGTAFPLLFDDVPDTKFRKGTQLEVLFKSYWQDHWRPKVTTPQIIMSTNRRNLPGWLNTRIKRIEFDIKYPNDDALQRRLGTLMAEENPFFAWYAHEYLAQLGQLPATEVPGSDELQLGRGVMVALYRHAGRTEPAYFLHEPVEARYSPGRQPWLDALDVNRRARLYRQGPQVHVHFDADIHFKKVEEYASMLPQEVKAKTEGNRIMIENPAPFFAWLYAYTKPPWTRRVLIHRMRTG